MGQSSQARKPYKGPRAIGLIELPANGRPQFVPIAILVNGDFYDASAYKADPVPMALWPETVYEGVRSGISQGLFTVNQAVEDPKTTEWIADGTWLPAGSIPKTIAKKHESSVPRGMDDDSGSPVLRHSGDKKPEPPTPASPAPDATKSASTASPPVQAAPQQTPPPPPSQPSPATTTTTQASPAPADGSSEQDPNAPVLRRGKPAPKPAEALTPPPTPASKTTSRPSGVATTAKAPTSAPTVQVFPAISDADGPEPRPYSYDLKPGEEEQLRKRMLALAADEIATRAKQLAPESAPSPTPRTRAKKSTPVQPDFQNVQLRIFDLSLSNEPVLVLTANAQMPKPSANAAVSPRYAIALVAREDINGDFHKAFSQVTDADHLDVLPRYELIDAVDADGDGRGELLFREISDTSSAFAIYRVIGDQLYPLFQGTL